MLFGHAWSRHAQNTNNKFCQFLPSTTKFELVRRAKNFSVIYTIESLHHLSPPSAFLLPSHVDRAKGEKESSRKRTLSKEEGERGRQDGETSSAEPSQLSETPCQDEATAAAGRTSSYDTEPSAKDWKECDQKWTCPLPLAGHQDVVMMIMRGCCPFIALRPQHIPLPSIRALVVLPCTIIDYFVKDYPYLPWFN
jgi:hypothetical protein